MNITTTSTSERIRQLGLTLPAVPAPLAAYAPAVRVDTNWVFTAGQLPMRDGELVATGRVGADLDVAAAAEAARVCAINAVAAISELAGGPDNIEQIVKVVGFVASADGFDEQPAVLDGASSLLLELFGAQIGQHSRSAVGVSTLPRNAAVEVEVIARIKGA